MKNRALWVAIGSGLAMLAGSASAATWNGWVPSGNGVCATGYNCYGNARTATIDGVTTTVTAWSFTADSGGSTNNALANAYLSDWGGGLGVNNRDQTTSADSGEASTSGGNHAVDNYARNDFVLFSFADSVSASQALISLTSITTGWVSGDSDITVLAYNNSVDGAAAIGASTLLNGKTGSGLTASDWTVIGHYGAGGGTAGTIPINAGGVSSAYWLVGAYAPTRFTGTNYNSADTGTSNYDYLKIAAVSGAQTTQVPEPSSMFLFGGALLASLLTARRARSRVRA